jgi:hypothetical protein
MLPSPSVTRKKLFATPGRGDVHADDDVHPIVILPERPDLHLEQVFWGAEAVNHLLQDQVVHRILEVVPPTGRSSLCGVLIIVVLCALTG